MQKNVLLVDDESSLRRSLFLGLSQEGYAVEPCENGVNAIRKLDLYKKNDINLDTVVLDIQLPDIDGIKLGKIIKSKYPNTNIIFITGYSDKINESDIENLSEFGLLEKPFSARELTEQIEQIMKENKHTTTTEAPAPKITKVPEITTFSAYALLKIDREADFFSVFRTLYFDPNVLYCDATKGEFDIFLLIQSKSLEGCKEYCENTLKNMKEIKEIEYLEVSNPILDDSLKSVLNVFNIDSSDMQIRDSRNAVCSYVLVEIEKEKLDVIYPSLYFNDNVVYCDYTESRYNLIALVHGTQFSEIDNLVKNKIATLDGVLKVKEFPIITLFEM